MFSICVLPHPPSVSSCKMMVKPS